MEIRSLARHAAFDVPGNRSDELFPAGRRASLEMDHTRNCLCSSGIRDGHYFIQSVRRVWLQHSKSLWHAGWFYRADVVDLCGEFDSFDRSGNRHGASRTPLVRSACVNSLLWLAATVLLVIFFAPAALSQELQPDSYAGFEGQTVSKIEIAVRPGEDAEQIRALLRQEAGKPFSFEAI